MGAGTNISILSLLMFILSFMFGSLLNLIGGFFGLLAIAADMMSPDDFHLGKFLFGANVISWVIWTFFV